MHKIEFLDSLHVGEGGTRSVTDEGDAFIDKLFYL